MSKRTTKLYKFLFEGEEAQETPETSMETGGIQVFTVDAKDAVPEPVEGSHTEVDAMEDVEELQNTMDAIASAQQVKDVQPGIVQEQKSRTLSEMLNFLFEDEERGGIEQQQHVCDTLAQYYPESEGWKFVANNKGEQYPDITISKDGKPVAYVEVKSNKGGMTAIYDKSMRRGSDEIKEFDELAKALAMHNGVKVYAKQGKQAKELTWDQVSALGPGKIFDAILVNGKAGAGGVECGSYGQLAVDPEALKTIQAKSYKFGNYLSSHEPTGFSVYHPKTGKPTAAFYPRVKGLPDPTNKDKKIFFHNPTKNTYVELDVKFKSEDTDWGYLTVGSKKLEVISPDGSMRPASTSGGISTRCFKFTKATEAKPETITDSGSDVSHIAYETIYSHWTAGSHPDSYFVIVDGSQIFMFHVEGQSDPLELEGKIPTFGPDNMRTVSLTTYGKGGIDTLRVALKTDISRPPELTSVLSK